MQKHNFFGKCLSLYDPGEKAFPPGSQKPFQNIIIQGIIMLINFNFHFLFTYIGDKLENQGEENQNKKIKERFI